MKAKGSVAKTTNHPTLAWCLKAACAARLLPLMLFLLPAAAQAQTYTNSYGIWNYWDNGDGTATIAVYTGSIGNVTIPDMINGLSVIRIMDGAFWHCTSLTNVTIPSSVTSMGESSVAMIFGVFGDCSNLIGVYFLGNAPSLLVDSADTFGGYCC